MRLILVQQLAVAFLAFESEYRILEQLRMVIGSVVGTNLLRNSFSTVAQKIGDFSLPTSKWCTSTDICFRSNAVIDQANSISTRLSYCSMIFSLLGRTDSISPPLCLANQYGFPLKYSPRKEIVVRRSNDDIILPTIIIISTQSGVIKYEFITYRFFNRELPCRRSCPYRPNPSPSSTPNQQRNVAVPANRNLRQYPSTSNSTTTSNYQSTRR